MSAQLPENWEVMSRSDKISWGKDYLANHLAQETYQSAEEELVYPDEDIQEISKDDFENLPGWASWTAEEASDWIDANVTDLAAAKIVLQTMAKAIIYLRDVSIEQ